MHSPARDSSHRGRYGQPGREPCDPWRSEDEASRGAGKVPAATDTQTNLVGRGVLGKYIRGQRTLLGARQSVGRGLGRALSRRILLRCSCMLRRTCTRHTVQVEREPMSARAVARGRAPTGCTVSPPVGTAMRAASAQTCPKKSPKRASERPSRCVRHAGANAAQDELDKIPERQENRPNGARRPSPTRSSSTVSTNRASHRNLDIFDCGGGDHDGGNCGRPSTRKTMDVSAFRSC